MLFIQFLLLFPQILFLNLSLLPFHYFPSFISLPLLSFHYFPSIIFLLLLSFYSFHYPIFCVISFLSSHFLFFSSPFSFSPVLFSFPVPFVFQFFFLSSSLLLSRSFFLPQFLIYINIYILCIVHPVDLFCISESPCKPAKNPFLNLNLFFKN